VAIFILLSIQGKFLSLCLEIPLDPERALLIATQKDLGSLLRIGFGLVYLVLL
jgi:hypothetical protein